MQCGKGIETWTDNSNYNGNYVDGKKNGIGKYSWADGSSYNGEWKDNKKHGFGIQIFGSGDKYEGGWMQNMRFGKGTFEIPIIPNSPSAKYSFYQALNG